ncbi:hypothetical protein FHU39_003466 [Flexivirga oryzae]|uniref:Restriction system protein n=2 Tax=Flexivirga oryzae TaxID=1794944 RepID=A0A839NE40_9MICO|nr:hypothetical protein [Flexivirga oryzae]
MSARFGGAKKHAEEVARLQALHNTIHANWDQQRSALLGEHAHRMAEHEQAEAARKQRLNFDRMKYQSECEQRVAQVEETNRHADEMLDAYDQGHPAAVRDLIEVCLGLSSWPDFMPDDQMEIDYAADDQELMIVHTLPSPDVVPAVREYKYRPTTDEIASTKLPVTERKRLYRGFIASAAARTIAEVFTHDTARHIASISYRGVIEGIDPATGQDTTITLVAVATDRERFSQLELTRVDPEAMLKHLGAVMSKSPLDMRPAPTAGGVRTVGR